MANDHDKLIEIEIKQQQALLLLGQINTNTADLNTRVTKLETFRTLTMWAVGLTVPSCIAGYFAFLN